MVKRLIGNVLSSIQVANVVSIFTINREPHSTLQVKIITLRQQTLLPPHATIKNKEVSIKNKVINELCKRLVSMFFYLIMSTKWLENCKYRYSSLFILDNKTLLFPVQKVRFYPRKLFFY